MIRAQVQSNEGLRVPEKAPLPPTSLIIPTRNRPTMVATAVGSVLGGDDVPAEIIVVDQSDVENPELRALRPPDGTEVRYLWRPGRGVSRARNTGIVAAKHEILGFTDDDVRVTAGWWGALVRALLAGGSKVVVVGAVRPGEPEVAGAFAPSVTEDVVARAFAGRVDEDPLLTGNMAIHRSAFDEVGPFDERLGPGSRFPGAEDNDLGYRLLEAGFVIKFRPEAALIHRAWRDERAYLPIAWGYARGQGAFYAKHLSFRDRYTLGRMARVLRHRFGRLRHRSRRDRALAYRDVVWMLGCLAGAAEWLLIRPRAH